MLTNSANGALPILGKTTTMFAEGIFIFVNNSALSFNLLIGFPKL
jgi:hypothetical protein